MKMTIYTHMSFHEQHLYDLLVIFLFTIQYHSENLSLRNCICHFSQYTGEYFTVSVWYKAR